MGIFDIFKKRKNIKRNRIHHNTGGCAHFGSTGTLRNHKRLFGAADNIEYQKQLKAMKES